MILTLPDFPYPLIIVGTLKAPGILSLGHYLTLFCFFHYLAPFLIDFGHFTMRAFLSRPFDNGDIPLSLMCYLAPQVWSMYLSKFCLQVSALKSPPPPPPVHFPWINEAWTEFLSCLLPSRFLIPKFVIVALFPQELCCLSPAGQAPSRGENSLWELFSSLLYRKNKRKWECWYLDYSWW